MWGGVLIGGDTGEFVSATAGLEYSLFGGVETGWCGRGGRLSILLGPERTNTGGGASRPHRLVGVVSVAKAFPAPNRRRPVVTGVREVVAVVDGRVVVV